MTYSPCAACGSPSILLFRHPLCVWVGCRFFDQRTYEDWQAEPIAPVRGEEAAGSAEPWGP